MSCLSSCGLLHGERFIDCRVKYTQMNLFELDFDGKEA